MSRAIIRQGDSTSHGGIVIEGIPSFIVEGQPIALIGHMVHCPKCRGNFPIVVDGHIPTTFMGMPVALDGMKTSCGAVLIASQQVSFVETASGGGGAGAHGASAAEDAFASMFSPYVAEEDAVGIKQYDEQFLLNDGAGQPLPGTYYTAKLPTGELVHGVTDANGKTERYSTNSAHQIEIHIGHIDNS